MRVLVAGRNAKVLAKAAGTFANDLKISTATTKADCFTLLARTEFDLIVACETLSDGSGLEVLSHVAVNTPNTLRIFAARPATLNLLKGELGLFGLFRTLPYPINFRKLWAAISLARSACGEPEPATGPARAGAALRKSVPVATPAPAATAAESATPASRVRHVVLEDAWGAKAPPAPAPTTSAAGRRPPTQPSAPARARTQQAPQHERPSQQQFTSGMRAAARYAAAHAARDVARDMAAPPSRIPESEAFKRARARREAGVSGAGVNGAGRNIAVKSDAGSTHPRRTDAITSDPGSTHPRRHDAGRSGNSTAGRREPVMSTHSLAQLAKLAATRRPPAQVRNPPAAKRRAALFVGSGVFAATTLGVLTFFMVNANNSVKRSKLPVIASINQPMPHKVFPWQPETRQPTQQAAFMRSEASPAAVADLEAEAEAASETLDGDPDHPGPPPPNAPPPPSEPPSLESPAQPVDE